MNLRAAVIVSVLALLLAGCSGGSPHATQSPASGLRQVQPSTPQDLAQVKALAADQGQPWGSAPVQHTWSHVVPDQLPHNLIPSVTLGRGLLYARAANAKFSPPTSPRSVAAADLLFERGLLISAVTRNPWGGANPDAAQWASTVAKYPGNAATALQSTAVVNGVPAEVWVGQPSYFGGTDTVVAWVVAPWSYRVELQGNDVPGALRVADSLGH
jgi:hypothetical protein